MQKEIKKIKDVLPLFLQLFMRNRKTLNVKMMFNSHFIQDACVISNEPIKPELVGFFLNGDLTKPVSKTIAVVNGYYISKDVLGLIKGDPVWACLDEQASRGGI